MKINFFKKENRLLLFFLICLQSYVSAQDFDVVILGSSPAGIMSAIAAAKRDKTVLLIERSKHIGGLLSNSTYSFDPSQKHVNTGLFNEFTQHIQSYYKETYGKDSPQWKASKNGYLFEPSVAELVFKQMLDAYPNIEILTMHQLNVKEDNVHIKDKLITEIIILDRESQKIKTISGKMFIDASYEGDLAAAAKVPFRIGRESKTDFNEFGAGKVYKYWLDAESNESTYEGDDAIQAYNFRLCLTKDKENSIPIAKPENYNSSIYSALVHDIINNKHTAYPMAEVSNQPKESSKLIPSELKGIQRIVHQITLPNQKTDADDQALSFISTDLQEENWEWATQNWEWRDAYSEKLKNYVLGLLWFAQNDNRLPDHFRKDCQQWGLSKEEFTDNHFFPRQVNVREARRIQGYYLFTANDALAVEKGNRPPVHKNSITVGNAPISSHGVRKREGNKIHLDGYVHYDTQPYTIPYFVIVTKGVNNLLCTSASSATHLGLSAIRHETVQMSLGQSAGIAASLAIEMNIAFKRLRSEELQKELIQQKITLIHFDDMTPENPAFAAVQYFGLRGYFTDWEFHPNEPIDKKTANLWFYLANEEVNYKAGKSTRAKVITDLFNKLK